MKKASSTNNLAVAYPELVPEWEPSNTLAPTQVTPTASYRAKWKCKNGHTWETSVANRVSKARGRRSECPVCKNRKLGTSTMLYNVAPTLLTEWDYLSNKHVTPESVLIGRTKVWWKCKKGHSWAASTYNRVRRRQGCPKCSRQSSKIEKRLFSELLAIFPDTKWGFCPLQSPTVGRRFEYDCYIPSLSLAIEYDGAKWHVDSERDLRKNKMAGEQGVLLLRLRETPLPLLSPIDIRIAPNSDHAQVCQAMFKRINEMFPYASYIDREVYSFKNEKLFLELTSYEGKLNSLAMVPSLVGEWSKRNSPMKPSNFTLSSSFRAWWVCSVCLCEFQVTIAARVKGGKAGGRCPVCRFSGRASLSRKFPEVAKFWDYEKNNPLTPDRVAAHSNKPVWWKCLEGHAWYSVINNLAKKGRVCCRFCQPSNSGLKAINTAVLARKQWDQQKLTSSDSVLG